ncbi:unnamed protein product [Chironomus riparius]|uniref:CHHC U11-48K-type domain-containing protein n=1 Tax=Chironomus riparius TaxID=315576 RepID=A0A9N9WZ22_9DIPT|nr:unnamed protein product [Chironomus riparius]
MSYNDSVPEAEQTTVCPYNKAHVVLNFRFNNHLIKCRKSYTGEELETCPFNSSHKINKPEFYFHKKTCMDRKNVLNYIQTDQTEEPKEKKKVKEWDEDEELKTNDEKLKELSESTELSATDLNDNNLDFDQIDRKRQEYRQNRHGYDDENDKKPDNSLYNPMSHLKNALKSNNNPHLDQSDRHSVHSNHNDDNNQIISDEDISNNSEKSKKVVKDWSDEEDDVPLNVSSSGPKTYEYSQNDNRNYRESSTESFRSNRSHFQQNKIPSRFAHNHSNSPHSSKSRNSPYNRPESRQFRETSRESDSNVSTTSKSSQNFRQCSSFDLKISRFESQESPGSRGSSISRDSKDFSRHSRSREPSKSREPSTGFNKHHIRPDRRNSNASGYSSRSSNRGSHQKCNNGRFEKLNSGSSSKFEDEFTKILEYIDQNPQEIPRHPANEEISHSLNDDNSNSQPARKTATDWSDEDDDVPTSSASNYRLPQNSLNCNSSPQSSYVSSTTEAEVSLKPPETEKKKLQDWSDDEDDVTPSSAPQSNNFNDSTSNWSRKTSKYESGRWDDDDNVIPITKSKRSSKMFSDRPSDEEILERFAKLSNFKDFMSVDSHFDRTYRTNMNGNIGIFNMEF